MNILNNNSVFFRINHQHELEFKSVWDFDDLKNKLSKYQLAVYDKDTDDDEDIAINGDSPESLLFRNLSENCMIVDMFLESNFYREYKLIGTKEKELKIQNKYLYPDYPAYNFPDGYQFCYTFCLKPYVPETNTEENDIIINFPEQFKREDELLTIRGKLTGELKDNSEKVVVSYKQDYYTFSDGTGEDEGNVEHDNYDYTDVQTYLKSDGTFSFTINMDDFRDGKIRFKASAYNSEKTTSPENLLFSKSFFDEKNNDIEASYTVDMYDPLIFKVDTKDQESVCLSFRVFDVGSSVATTDVMQNSVFKYPPKLTREKINKDRVDNIIVDWGDGIINSYDEIDGNAVYGHKLVGKNKTFTVKIRSKYSGVILRKFCLYEVNALKESDLTNDSYCHAVTSNSIVEIIDYGSIAKSYCFYKPEGLIKIPKTLNSSLTYLTELMYGATNLNDKDILDWDFGGIKNADYMLYNARSFNQNMSGIDIEISVPDNFATNTKLTNDMLPDFSG